MLILEYARNNNIKIEISRNDNNKSYNVFFYDVIINNIELVELGMEFAKDDNNIFRNK